MLSGVQNLLMTSSSCEEGSDYEDDVLATATTEQGSVLRSGSDVAADICAKLAALRTSSDRPVGSPPASGEWNHSSELEEFLMTTGRETEYQWALSAGIRPANKLPCPAPPPSFCSLFTHDLDGGQRHHHYQHGHISTMRMAFKTGFCLRAAPQFRHGRERHQGQVCQLCALNSIHWTVRRRTTSGRIRASFILIVWTNLRCFEQILAMCSPTVWTRGRATPRTSWLPCAPRSCWSVWAARRRMALWRWRPQQRPDPKPWSMRDPVRAAPQSRCRKATCPARPLDRPSWTASYSTCR